MKEYLSLVDQLRATSGFSMFEFWHVHGPGQASPSGPGGRKIIVLRNVLTHSWGLQEMDLFFKINSSLAPTGLGTLRRAWMKTTISSVMQETCCVPGELADVMRSSRHRWFCSGL